MRESLYAKRFLFSLLVFSLLVCLFPLSALAAENNAGVMKVGVLNNSSYAYRDDSGVWRGSDVECMIDIAQKAGFKAEFVDSTTDVDLFKHLDDGTYDMRCFYPLETEALLKYNGFRILQDTALTTKNRSRRNP